MTANPLQILGELAARLAATDGEPPLADALRLLATAFDARGLALWRIAQLADPAARVGDADAADPLVHAALAAAFAGRATAGGELVGRPLLAGGRVLGAIVVRWRGAPAPDEEQLLVTAAHLLAMALDRADRARLHERETAERGREIDAERRFVQQVVDSLPVGLHVVDRDFRIQLWNRRREMGLQGVSRETALGRSIFEILHRQPAERLRREFEEVFASGTAQNFDMESNASGEPRRFRISKIPMRLDGGPVSHVITVGEDITEWHAAQRRFAQAEKLAAIGQLAAGVMHEINNPLATIGACAESLELALGDLRDQGVNLPSSCGEYVRIVESEVQRCKRIVERLLQYSRPVPADAEPVDLNAVVEQTLFLLKHHARFKQFVVETDFAPGASPVVRGSTEQLVQVLMALLINAMDAMPEPGTIHVRTRMPARRDTAVIEVQDEGHGIPRTELTKIFEPFYTTKAPGRGTGLGLSICYGIVTEHGGTIEVESHQGAGSTFRVCIPVVRAA